MLHGESMDDTAMGRERRDGLAVVEVPDVHLAVQDAPDTD